MKLKWEHIKELSDRLIEDPSGSKAAWFWGRLEGYDVFRKQLLWQLAADYAWEEYGGQLVIKHKATEIR